MPGFVKIIVAIVAVLLAGVLLVGFYAVKNVHIYGEELLSPETCEEEGYSYRICSLCGKLDVTETYEKKEHEFGETVKSIKYETAVAFCKNCGFSESREYIPPEGIARIYLEGNPSGESAPVTFEYIDENGIQSGFGEISINAETARTNTKPTYDLTLYSDEEHTAECEYVFSGEVGNASSITLKSEFYDSDRIRNLTASEIWEQTVGNREKLSGNLSSVAHFGADCGYPVLLYTNHHFAGVYDLCIDNASIADSMSQYANAAVLYTYSEFGDFDFEFETDKGTVPVRILYVNDESKRSNAQESFMRMIDFAKSADERSFTRRIGNYLDVDAAIDYILCAYAFGLPENALYYCNWATYDGIRWIPSLYRLTEAFSYDASFAPTNDGESVSSGTGFVLYDKLLTCFFEKACERYAFLRENVLSESNILAVAEKQALRIPDEVFDAEREKYGASQVNKTFFEQNESIELKLDELDSFFGYAAGEN